MAVFELHNRNGVCFNRNPTPVKMTFGKGWVIQCHSDDTSLYGGHYTKQVGFADTTDATIGVIGFRLKRDAVRAIEQGKALGLFLD